MSAKADFKAARETCGLSQQDVADALGVRATTVKRWERPGFPEPPEDAREWLRGMLDAHERAVLAMLVLAERRLEEDGVREVSVTYLRDQAEYDALGRDPGPFGVVNARSRDAAAILRDEGFDVSFAYPGEL